MSRFITRDIERIDLGDDDWVDLRTRLTFGDRQAITEKLIGGGLGLDGRMRDGQAVELFAGNVEALLRSIVAWGGPGFCEQAHPHDGDCRPRAINRESVEALDETGERILVEIQKRQVTATPGFTSARTSSAPVDTSLATPMDGVSSRSRSSDSPVGAGTK